MNLEGWSWKIFSFPFFLFLSFFPFFSYLHFSCMSWRFGKWELSKRMENGYLHQRRYLMGKLHARLIMKMVILLICSKGVFFGFFFLFLFLYLWNRLCFSIFQKAEASIFSSSICIPPFISILDYLVQSQPLCRLHSFWFFFSSWEGEKKGERGCELVRTFQIFLKFWDFISRLFEFFWFTMSEWVKSIVRVH